jgi:hypothetical protein
VTLGGADVRKIEGVFFAVTFVVYDGLPFYRVDWEVIVTWERGRAYPGKDDAKVKIVKKGPDWNREYTAGLQKLLGHSFTHDDRIWTKKIPPK